MMDDDELTIELLQADLYDALEAMLRVRDNESCGFGMNAAEVDETVRHACDVLNEIHDEVVALMKRKAIPVFSVN